MFREIRYYLKFATQRIVQCFGITKHPESGDYAIMLTHTGETLSSYIKSNKSLNFKRRMILLNCIASGLNSIHERGLVHRDFHDRNILIANHQSGGIYPYIIDLGLCRKEDEKDRNEYYGLPCYLPFEHFEYGQYKRPSDVYAFVINDKWLKFKEDTNLPSLLVELIKLCCDRNPLNRPSTKFLENITERWSKDVGFYGEKYVNKTSKFYKQYEEMEKKENKNYNY
ncbi:10336_t:CDS:2 [Ambispora leptoticha]|uniref:10336_t:CDS:1 n=1 Tax=Ambispora leptoticha TaxID=144679 RepID=A0A9N9G632_9GLOM|nr:10336_t:CDS:2 [Ambispora leptoticha]